MCIPRVHDDQNPTYTWWNKRCKEHFSSTDPPAICWSEPSCATSNKRLRSLTRVLGTSVRYGCEGHSMDWF